MKFIKENLAIIVLSVQLLFGAGNLYMMNGFVTRDDFNKHVTVDQVQQIEMTRNLFAIEKSLSILALNNDKIQDHESRIRFLEQFNRSINKDK